MDYERLINLISLNILVFVPLEFFEEFENVTVFFIMSMMKVTFGLTDCPLHNTVT